MNSYKCVHEMRGEYRMLLDALGMVIGEIDHQSAVQSGMAMTAGLIVMVVWWGDVADLAGVEAGDIISEVDGKQVMTLKDLHHVLAAHESRKPIRFLFRRVGGWRFLSLPFTEQIAGEVQRIYSSVQAISHFNSDMYMLMAKDRNARRKIGFAG